MSFNVIKKVRCITLKRKMQPFVFKLKHIFYKANKRKVGSENYQNVFVKTIIDVSVTLFNTAEKIYVQ